MTYALLALTAIGLLLTIALLFTQGTSFWLRTATVAVYLAGFVVALIAFNSNHVVIKTITPQRSFTTSLSTASTNLSQPKLWVSMILITTLVMLTAVRLKAIRWPAMLLAFLFAMGCFGWVTLSVQQVRGRSNNATVVNQAPPNKSIRYVTPDGKTIRWVRPDQVQALNIDPASSELIEVGPNFFGIPTDS